MPKPRKSGWVRSTERVLMAELRVVSAGRPVKYRTRSLARATESLPPVLSNWSTPIRVLPAPTLDPLGVPEI